MKKLPFSQRRQLAQKIEYELCRINSTVCITNALAVLDRLELLNTDKARQLLNPTSGQDAAEGK